MADVTIAIEAESRSKTRADVSVRNLTFSVDEPEKLGGTNTGPNAVETRCPVSNNLISPTPSL